MDIEAAAKMADEAKQKINAILKELAQKTRTRVSVNIYYDHDDKEAGTLLPLPKVSIIEMRF